MVIVALKLKDTCSLEEKLWQHIKKQRHHFIRGPYSQSYGFSSSQVQMWELNHKEGWVLKNWCFRVVVLEKTLESLLDCKEIKPVNPKGNQSWLFAGKTDAEAEAPIFCPPDVKNWLLRKDPDAGRDWRQEEKGTTEDKMVGWHHQLDGPQFEQASGDDEGQGSLERCCPWDSPDNNTGMNCRALLQEIFLTQGSNLCLLNLLQWQADSLLQGPPGKTH